MRTNSVVSGVLFAKKVVLKFVLLIGSWKRGAATSVDGPRAQNHRQLTNLGSYEVGFVFLHILQPFAWR